MLAEKGSEALLDVLALFADNGLIAGASEEKLGDDVVPNMLVFAEEDSAGLLKGFDVE